MRAFWERVFRGPSASRRQALYEELAAMERAGIGLREGLGSLLDNADARDTAFLEPLARAVDGGSPLAPAMRADPVMYTALESSIVSSGEKSGHLDEALRSLAAQMERSVRLRSSLLKAAAYPTLVLHIAILLPPLPIIVVMLKLNVAVYVAFVLVALALFWGPLVFAVSYHGAQAGSAAYGRRLERLPGIGRAVRNAALARFFRAFGALHAAGSSMDLALEEAAEAAGNGWYRQQFLAGVPRLRSGDSLALALAPVQGLPRESRAAIETGEKSGSLSETMERLATLHEERLEAALATVAQILPGVLVLLVGVLVGAVAIWFYGSRMSGMLEL